MRTTDQPEPFHPLERVTPEKPKADPDAYKPLKDRPGWAENSKGQLQRTPELPPPEPVCWGDYLKGPPPGE